MLRLNEAGLPSFFDLVPPLDKLNTEQTTNLELAVLLAVLQSQADAIATNIDLLYQSWFIETCDNWTVSYIAELLAIPESLSDARFISRHRALVANALAYRSYRGTAAALACAIQDASGWPVQLVEGISKQFTSVQGNIPSRRQPTLIELGEEDSVVEPSDPFSPDHTSYSVYLTPITPPTGKDQIALYYWREKLTENTYVEATPIDDGLFYLDPVLREVPLLIPHTSIPLPGNSLPHQLPIPLPLTRTAFSDLTKINSRKQLSPFTLFIDGQIVPSSKIISADLGPRFQEKDTENLLDTTSDDSFVLVDPERGIVKPFWTAKDNQHSIRLHASSWTATTGNYGGGIYDRSARMVLPDAVTWSVLVTDAATTTLSSAPPAGYDAVYPTVNDALTAWGKNKFTEIIVHLADNNRHKLPDTKITLTDNNKTLVIQAAQGFTPSLSGNLSVSSIVSGEIWISGCFLRGSVFFENDLNATFVDCTMWPVGNTAIQYKKTTSDSQTRGYCQINLDHCICGPLILPGKDCDLSISDSIIDGCDGPALSGPTDIIVENSGETTKKPIGAILSATTTTFLGDVYTLQLLETRDTLLKGALHTPRNSWKNPSDGIWITENQPQATQFVSLTPGSAGYAVLGQENPISVLQGGSSGSEFGVFHDQFNAKRFQAIDLAIQDYCPVDMQVTLIDRSFLSHRR